MHVLNNALKRGSAESCHTKGIFLFFFSSLNRAQHLNVYIHNVEGENGKLYFNFADRMSQYMAVVLRSFRTPSFNLTITTTTLEKDIFLLCFSRHPIKNKNCVIE
jgi:hypothetical protein